MKALPQFRTARLLLTPVSLADAPAYQQHFVDYEVIRNLSSQVPWPYPADGVAYFFEHMLMPLQGTARWTWAIRRQTHPDEVIGCVDLWRQGKPENRGFWLGRKFWGQGYMTEAVVPVTDHAFYQLGFETLVFSNALGNVKSRRVKEKTGARFVGLAPAAFVDPQYTQQEVWELAKADWLAWRRQDRPPG